jgi:SAM-dependent methyltransferase
MSGVWLIFPFVGAIRLSTVLAFLATMVILGLARRSLLVGVIAGMAWVSAFEIVFQVAGAFEGRYDWLHIFYLTFSLTGWVVAAHVAGIRPHPLLLLAWGLAFLGWIAFGLHPNRYAEPGRFSISQEIFNVLTKDGLAAIYIAGGLAPFGWVHSPRRPVQDPARSAVVAGVAAFDAVAADYDRGEVENPIRQLMRSRSLSVLDRTFPSGAALVDVGCGTGTEAIWLAQRGYRVTAVDSSQAMLDVLHRRAAVANLDIPTRLMKARDLSALVDELGEGSFDGAYSSFGALNTEPSVERPLAALARILRPGGRLVVSVMNRWCVAEMALMLAGGRTDQAFRRLRPWLAVAVGSTFTEVTYPSWLQLKRALDRDFSPLSVQALTLLLPPYSWPAFASHARTYRALARLDQCLAPHRPFAWLGDHLLVVAERRSVGLSGATLPHLWGSTRPLVRPGDGATSP